MRLFNTLTKKIAEVSALAEGDIKFFVCGPTVYDFAHVGNAKTYIQFDVLARVLRQSGFKVFYLQNITDIDDKIIARAQEQGISWEQLRSKYEAQYMSDMKTLNNTSVTQFARATDYIQDIIQQVQVLIEKGHAYKTQDGIYFEISTFPEYGKLSGRTQVEENDAESRIDQSDQKRGWNDFCLWKFSKPGEPVWDAPFGNGRPGWHIEDTAITEHFFGPQYDIHGGAVDLIFPHHEAEITQMEAASGKKPMVRYWVHAGFLNVDNKRMGKSLGNFYTIAEVLEKGYDPMALRLFVLQSHYRSSINFSWENLDSAQSKLKSLQAMSDLRWQTKPTASGQIEREKWWAEIYANLADDLNTPKALATLYKVETMLQDKLIPDDMANEFESFLASVDAALGLNLLDGPDISTEQKKLIEQRQHSRDAQDWETADSVRQTLEQQGVGVRDTGYGPVWYRL